MSRRRRALGALRGQRGHTLVELLWVAVLGVVIFGIGLALLNFAVRTQPTLSDRAASIQQGRAMIERLTRELRQGSEVTTATSSDLVFETYVKRTACGGSPASSSIACQVTYSCASGTCTRTERNPDGSGSAAAVQWVDGLSNDAVFAYLPNAALPEYVNVTLTFPAEQPGEDAVTLRDGVNLRNSF
jgi:hypothetical protein